MFGTGLTFGVGVGALATLVGSIAVLIGGGSFLQVLRTAGRFSVAGFLLGIGFSAILAITARRWSLAKLSIPRAALLGAGAGLIYFALISINGIGHWSLSTAILNFVLLTGLGGGSAAATLMVARRAGATDGESVADQPKDLPPSNPDVRQTSMVGKKDRAGRGADRVPTK
jgi:hypothetical protein